MQHLGGCPKGSWDKRRRVPQPKFPSFLPQHSGYQPLYFSQCVLVLPVFQGPVPIMPLDHYFFTFCTAGELAMQVGFELTIPPTPTSASRFLGSQCVPPDLAWPPLSACCFLIHLWGGGSPGVQLYFLILWCFLHTASTRGIFMDVGEHSKTCLLHIQRAGRCLIGKHKKGEYVDHYSCSQKAIDYDFRS